MPELPEVEALVGFLREQAVGQVVARVDVSTISVLKTYDPPVTALGGLMITGVARRGKFVDLDCDGLHFVTHLARGGWLRWSEKLPAAPPRPGRGPIALRVLLANGSGFDLTEAGTRKRLAVYVVRDPADVPGVARLGIDPLSDEFTVARLRSILDTAGRSQVKGVLRDQSVVAGIGNAYSDEVLHVARLSPFHPSTTLTDAEVATLHEAIVGTLRDAVKRSAGLAATSRTPNARGCGCTGAPASPVRSAATPSVRSRSPTRACSTARPVRPVGSRWPTEASRDC